MYTGKLIFSQVMEFMPLHTFRRCVIRYQGNKNVRSFACLDQYLCMAFAQLTYRESLRDIEACLRAQQQKLYHMGIRGTVARSNLADANEQRVAFLLNDHGIASRLPCARKSALIAPSGFLFRPGNIGDLMR